MENRLCSPSRLETPSNAVHTLCLRPGLSTVRVLDREALADTQAENLYAMGCALGADVFDRITIFEDHLVRDIDCGRFPQNTNLVFITHGLTLRIFLARWFHWTVKELESVWNPINSEPIVMERVAAEEQYAEVRAIRRTSHTTQFPLSRVCPSLITLRAFRLHLKRFPRLNKVAEKRGLPVVTGLPVNTYYRSRA